jgi:DNA polymerase III delta prime subunit
METLKILSIKKLDTPAHVYDLSVDETHNFFVGEKSVLTSNCDGLTGDAQRALRNIMEEYSGNLRFILTANYKNRLSKELRSRAIAYDITPPFKAVVARVVYVIATENVTVPEEQKPLLLELIQKNYPDIRKMIGLVYKYTKNGVLNITTEANVEIFAQNLVKQIRTEKSITVIREYIIQNEIEFSSDYLTLLKGLFEEIYISDIECGKRASALVLIGDAMYKHQFVMDFEINAFCCVVQLHKLMN